MKRLLFYAALAAVLFFCCFIPSEKANAANKADQGPVNITVDGTDIVYDGSIGRFSFNGKEVNIKKTPTYVFEDTAYINIKKVIYKAIPNAEYSINKKTGRIRITRGECSVEFYPGLPLMYKNGKAIYTRNIPKFIEKDGKAGEYYLPGRLVFESLGYSYTWDSDKKMSVVKETNATGVCYELYQTVSVLNNKPDNGTGDHHGTIRIKLPSAVSKDNVTVLDDIYKNEVYLSIKGDHRSFFEKTSIKDKCENCVLQIRHEYRIEDDVTVLTIVTQTDSDGLCLLHSEVITDNSVSITFDRAGNLYDRIVILDAGHGANDPGTSNFGIDEKDENLIIVKLVGKLLEKEGIKVFYSRCDDTLIPLMNRAMLGARLDADMFVSVHHNANNSPEKNGTSVYYSLNNPHVSGNGSISSSLMAQTLQAELLDALGTNDMKVLTTDFTVTKYNTVPSVLIELAFMSNPEECARLITDEFRTKAAQAIAESIISLYR